MSKAPMGRQPKLSLPRQKRRTSGDAASSTLESATDDASRLLADADAFLRLGLIDKAIEHLASAVTRAPTLRGLREPLVKLYVTQRLYKRAIDELWALLSPAENRQEEIRFLRYILRLGKDTAAEARLKTALSVQDSTPTLSGFAADSPSVSEVTGELRAHLGRHRPPTDLAETSRAIPGPASRLSLSDPPTSAVTRPNTDEAEAVAEELALSSGGLKEQLKEVEECLHAQKFAEAKLRLQALAQRFPHSKRVQTRLSQLEAAQAPMSKVGRISLRRQTVEIEPADITEETVLPGSGPNSKPRATPPPPPQPRAANQKKENAAADAARAYRTATTMRSFGQLQQAIQMFKQVRNDETYGAQATLMVGLCYRDLNRLEDAVRAFMQGVNMRAASESVLNELFFEVGYTHELLGNAGEAILYYQLASGPAGSYRDAEERIAALEESLRL